jgi:transcriptional regulator
MAHTVVMHTNPAFRRAPVDLALSIARDRGFGVLTIAGPDGPLASHVPFLLAGGGASVELHLARNNPILAALERPQPGLLAVSGPDGYVSPDWYGIADQVPTWNYLAVHLRGRLERAPDEALRPHLERLSAAFETRLAGKKPWTLDKMTPDGLDRFMRAIAPVTMAVERVDCTVKLNQNKGDAARLSAADAIAGGGIGQDLETLATLMRAPPA